MAKDYNCRIWVKGTNCFVLIFITYKGILFSRLLYLFKSCYNKSLKQKYEKRWNGEGPQSQKRSTENGFGTQERVSSFGTGENRKRLGAKTVPQGGGREVRENEEGFVWGPQNSQQRKGRTCLPMTEETGHWDWGLRERTLDSASYDARENKAWRKIAT